jgi:hypothetical protein
MKIITKTVWQMTPEGYELIEEESHDHHGPIAEAKGIGGGGISLPGYGDNNSSDSGYFSPGGFVNQGLDPLDLFGGNERGAANRAQRQLPGQLTALNNLQANVSRYDTKGPFGSSAWTIDPTTGRYTQTTNLNPSEQRQFDTRNGIAEQMLNTAQGEAPSVSSAFNYNSDVPAIAQQQLGKVQSLTNPVTQGADAAWSAKMANAGISPDSDAYKEALAQRTADTGAANYQQQQHATMQGAQLAQGQRQQRMAEIAQLMAGEQLNSPALGGNGIDVGGSTSAANQVGIDKANQAAAQRNANFSTLASFMRAAYPSGASSG